MFYIPVILGTAREGRQSEHVARFVFEELKKRSDVESEFVDVRDYVGSATVPSWEESTVLKPWRDIVSKSDGFIIVTPEYNHSFPGELKMLLDGAYKEYEGKVFGLCGVSSGMFGGARAVEHIKQVLNKFNVHIIRSAMYFPNVEELFKGGTINTEDQATYQKRLSSMFDELISFVNK